MNSKLFGNDTGQLGAFVQRIRRRVQVDKSRDRVNAFIFASSISILVSKMARELNIGAPLVGGGIHHHVAIFIVGELALVAFWIFGLMRFFEKIGWARWIVFPFVLLVLCPVEWLASRKMEPGADFMLLFALQLPIVIAYSVRRIQR
jgi:hypothetical protein